MRRFAWASPRAIKRLTPRQIHYLFTTMLPGDEPAAGASGASRTDDANGVPPEPPPSGSRAEYESLVGLVMTFGSHRREDADVEWLAKRGPIPPPEG